MYSKISVASLHSLLIIVLIGSFVLSVSAIRCHQCNSHLDPDCLSLRLNTPRAPLDEQYLRDCEPTSEQADTNQYFCRKVSTNIGTDAEQRIVRGCGYMKDVRRLNNTSCFDADNEGFKQRICACFSDGCNAAPSMLGKNQHFLIFAGIAMSVCYLSKLLLF